MKRWLVTASLMSLLATVMLFASSTHRGNKEPVVVPVRPEGSSLIKLLSFRYTKAELARGTYVGSEYCLACHTGGIAPDSTSWRDTKHAYVLRRPMGMYTLQPGKGVLANSLGGTQDDFMTGLDFNAKTGTPFDSLKPNAPILSYDAAADSYYIQLGPNGIKLLVAATWAGQSVGNGQRFMVRIPVADTPSGYSSAIYFPPLSWTGTSWTASTAAWYAGNTPKYASGIASSALVPLQSQNYLKTCAGCHITGIRSNGVTPQGEYVTHPYPATLVPDNSPDYPDLDGDGIPDIAGIGCESCHGPGSMHILGGGDPTKIVNPVDIADNRQRSAVCLQCHVQVASAPSKTWGYTFDETDKKPFVLTNPPDDLSKYQVFTGGLWPDGVHYVASRIDDFKSSAHFQSSGGIACNDCHDAMSETSNPSQVRDTIPDDATGAPIPASTANDSFCLSCHAGTGAFESITQDQVSAWQANFIPAIRPAIEAHTHHPYGADRTLGVSNCITCHMAPTAGHGDVSGYSHSFSPARPEDTIAYQNVTGLAYGGTGNVNSCASSCHRNRVRVWTDVLIDNSSPNNQFGAAYQNGSAISLANHLVRYYGPGGSWWDTAAAATSNPREAKP